MSHKHRVIKKQNQKKLEFFRNALMNLFGEVVIDIHKNPPPIINLFLNSKKSSDSEDKWTWKFNKEI